MTDFEPGQPIDHRTDGMRLRAFRSHPGDFEREAARVVARLTGEPVVIQDDNSAAAMVDVRIDYRDRPAGYVEVVMDIDPLYSAMASAIRGQTQVPAPDLSRVWHVTVSPMANVKTLKRDLPAALSRIEQAGVLFEVATFEQRLDSHEADPVRAVAALGVVRLASRPVEAAEQGKVIIYGVGAGGPAVQDWGAFGDWLTAFLHAPGRADVRRKLAATGAAERHAFVGMSFSTPWPAYHALSEHYRDLPGDPPRLPAEVTHVWVWSRPIGRCIAWFPDRGWFEPRVHWATA